jgi:hypothetical protein
MPDNHPFRISKEGFFSDVFRNLSVVDGFKWAGATLCATGLLVHQVLSLAGQSSALNPLWVYPVSMLAGVLIGADHYSRITHDGSQPTQKSMFEGAKIGAAVGFMFPALLAGTLGCLAGGVIGRTVIYTHRLLRATLSSRLPPHGLG